ncbi:MAG: bifunctional diaminohydroxyphosphoribosylaminopyrimidine deaminase/5-amino-6-(5-phosphoribosylamino)uracil reductase RibD [Verrucomicrobiaceae bacterium]|nr:bifunctional diaminohydroxyphosphoribosylaminopyrimidine deaminase/5-amino-6-(5-phosphoribosylamino)uracil reductase RibD [Verrucomicrobiaceae bacterium]
MKIRQRYVGPEGADQDRYWMRRALAQARLAEGATSPNPPVGAMLVKDSKLLAQGHHKQAGGPHAEISALQQLDAGGDAKGATLYVTLEPCSTVGRTGACTQAIIDHGIQRVVFGSVDPNPDHAGHAVSLFEKAGIAVTTGVCVDETDALIRIFRHWILTKRPYVIAKLGMSLDGRLTRPSEEPAWLTSKAARRDAQGLRLQVDAMVEGAETIRNDDPKLTLRYPQAPSNKRPLKRYVLTRSGDLPKEAHVFTDEFASETRVIQNATWPNWLDEVGAEGVTSVLLEGGGASLTEALLAQAVQEAHFYLAPMVSGGNVRGVQCVLGDWVALDDTQFSMIGDNVKVAALLNYEP